MMPMADDMELLREFAAHDSQEAFELLLNRHVHLVYSTALRLVRNPALADEVTQTVFIILARKAGRLGSKVVLSGWLYRTTQFAAARALRTEFRRREREREAIEMQTEKINSTWEELAPLLDRAMARLGEADRNALVLRFFENKSSRDVGIALGINEAAAQKRVARAVGKLRALCVKRGAVASVAGLTGIISANAVHAAPPNVIAGTAGAIHVAGAAAGSSALVKGTLALMRWAKVKSALTASAGVVALAAAVFLLGEAHWPQPHYGGRTLSAWMKQLDDGKPKSGLELPWVSWEKTVAGRSPEQKAAADAIRGMGESVLPYLRNALMKTDGRLDWLPQKLGLGEPPSTRRYRAMLALDALGPAAKPLLPQLAECLQGANCPKEAAMALAAIGPEGCDVLTKSIVSTTNFAAACSIWALGARRAGGPDTVAALEHILTSGEPPFQDAQAAWALAQIGQDRDQLVPMFIDGLKSKREDMRWACALALGELGPDACDAVPALVEALQDKEASVRRDAAQALQEIDPAAAARAGVSEPIAQRHIPKTAFY
jgi:RNA polymerase sigma factor (sigma-70 family)